MLKQLVRISIVVIIIITLAVPFADVQEANTTYYVDSANGNDSNDGTSRSSPWKTLSKVNSTTFGPGDQILFMRGRSWIGQLYPKGSGASGNPITIGAYGTGNRPIINGNGITGGAVYLKNQSYWVIQDLEVTNPGTRSGTVRCGIFVENNNGGTQQDIRILNNYVHDVAGTYYHRPMSGYDGHEFGGISVDVHGGPGSDKINDVLIEGNTVTYVGRCGIVFWDDDWNGTGKPSLGTVIRNNVVSHTDGDVIMTFGCDGSVIEYNVGHHGSQYSASGSQYFNLNAGIWTTRGFNNVIQYNESYATGPAIVGPGNADGEGYDIDIYLTNTTLQYNYSHDNSGGFILIMSGTNYVRYNISQNDNINGLYSGGVINFIRGNSNIYNNVIFIRSGGKPRIISDGNCTFENNIVYNLGSGGYTGTITADYNVFYGNHNSGEPYDQHKLTSDPMFVDPGSGGIGRDTVDGYKLQTGSPAIGSGVLISNNGGKDYWGNSVSSSSPPNRGAYNGPGIGSPRPTPTPDDGYTQAPRNSETASCIVNSSWPASEKDED